MLQPGFLRSFPLHQDRRNPINEQLNQLGKMTYKVEVDIHACIGCVACTSCDNFEMGLDGRAHTVKTEVDHPGCSGEVAEKCPVGAIKVTKSESCFHAI